MRIHRLEVSINPLERIYAFEIILVRNSTHCMAMSTDHEELQLRN